VGKRIQSVLLLTFLAMLIAHPALACLAPQQMSKAEMECCKQMSGGCDMSSANPTGASHPCCKNTVHSDAALLAAFSQQLLDTLAVITNEIPGAGLKTANLLSLVRSNALGSPPTSSSGANSVLRI
jgi:hypothetical protein